MEFCKKCRVLMFPHGNYFICNSCGKKVKNIRPPSVVEKQSVEGKKGISVSQGPHVDPALFFERPARYKSDKGDLIEKD